MNEHHKSQMAYLALIAVLFSITPFFSASYIYLLLNLLTIMSLLGTQTDFISFYKTQMGKKHVPISQIIEESSAEKLGHDTNAQKVKIVKVSSEQEKQNFSMDAKFPSSPSLFFIGGDTVEEAEVVEEGSNVYEEEEFEELSGEELFDKAEMFIGNFYKQLKMQREESWKKIHHGSFYQKAY